MRQRARTERRHADRLDVDDVAVDLPDMRPIFVAVVLADGKNIATVVAPLVGDREPLSRQPLGVIAHDLQRAERGKAGFEVIGLPADLAFLDHSLRTFGVGNLDLAGIEMGDLRLLRSVEAFQRPDHRAIAERQRRSRGEQPEKRQQRPTELRPMPLQDVPLPLDEPLLVLQIEALLNLPRGFGQTNQRGARRAGATLHPPLSAMSSRWIISARPGVPRICAMSRELRPRMRSACSAS